METIEIKIYDGLTGKCFRTRPNPDSPHIDESKIYEGTCFTRPEIGLRFRCGSLDTNIVARILEETNDTVRFETLSGSIYEFEYYTKGELRYVTELIIIPEIAEKIKAYKTQASMSKIHEQGPQWCRKCNCNTNHIPKMDAIKNGNRVCEECRCENPHGKIRNRCDECGCYLEEDYKCIECHR